MHHRLCELSRWAPNARLINTNSKCFMKLFQYCCMAPGRQWTGYLSSADECRLHVVIHCFDSSQQQPVVRHLKHERRKALFINQTFMLPYLLTTYILSYYRLDHRSISYIHRAWLVQNSATRLTFTPCAQDNFAAIKLRVNVKLWTKLIYGDNANSMAHNYIISDVIIDINRKKRRAFLVTAEWRSDLKVDEKKILLSWVNATVHKKA